MDVRSFPDLQQVALPPWSFRTWGGGGEGREGGKGGRGRRRWDVEGKKESIEERNRRWEVGIFLEEKKGKRGRREGGGREREGEEVSVRGAFIQYPMSTL